MTIPSTEENSMNITPGPPPMAPEGNVQPGGTKRRNKKHRKTKRKIKSSSK
jgi:hypothetical protein